jgi:hypothetical protein
VEIRDEIGHLQGHKISKAEDGLQHSVYFLPVQGRIAVLVE